MVSRWRFLMKKKIFCLVLAVLMLVPMICLAGCGESEEEESATKEADKTTATITMFMITERHVPTDADLVKLKSLAEGHDQYSQEYKDYVSAIAVKEAYERVADELNKMAKSKIRTQLVIYFYTEEEYVAVEEMMAKQIELSNMRATIKSELRKYTNAKRKEGIDAASAEIMFYEEHPEYGQYTVAETEIGEIATETIVNQYGIKELKYPDLQPNQVDIVCISGYDKYIEYISNGWLSQLDNELAGASKSIVQGLNEKFIEAAKVGNKTYGVPTNKAIGEYTFMLLNKELFDFYEYDIDTITGITSENFMEFLDDVARYRSDVTPLTGELDMTGVSYWNLEYEYVEAEYPDIRSEEVYYTLEDGKYNVATDIESGVNYYVVSGVKRTNDNFSLLGGAFAADATTDTFVPATNIFENEEYVAQLKTIVEIKEKGYYDADLIEKKDGEDYYDADSIKNASKSFAAAIVNGGAELAAACSDDYYVVKIDYPHTDNEALCSNLIGVSSGTVSLSRSMDVVSLITTNEEFRNLLQYGIAGQNGNYKIGEDGVLVRTNDYYMMDINVTGNVFMAHPEEGEPANKWSYIAKVQNREALYAPLSDFSIDGNAIDFSLMDEIKALSAEYKVRLDACQTLEELEAFIDAAVTELKANDTFKKATSMAAEEGELASLNKVYTDWYNATYKK